MHKMTPQETRAFLSQGSRTAKLATVRPDGQPHVVPVWFVLDGDDIIFTTWHTTVKAANLRHDARIALCVEDDALPYAFVEIEGTAAIQERAPDLLHWTTLVAGRYMGEALAASYGKRNAVEGEWLVRVTPTKTVAQRGIAE